MTRDYNLGEFEHMLLLAVARLRADAYAPEIARELEQRADRPVTRGALYSSLGRLEQKGFLVWHQEPPTPDRGGHARRRFELTEAGLEALRTYRRALERLWTDLDELLGGAR